MLSWAWKKFHYPDTWSLKGSSWMAGMQCYTVWVKMMTIWWSHSYITFYALIMSQGVNTQNMFFSRNSNKQNPSHMQKKDSEILFLIYDNTTPVTCSVVLKHSHRNVKKWLSESTFLPDLKTHEISWQCDIS